MNIKNIDILIKDSDLGVIIDRKSQIEKLTQLDKLFIYVYGCSGTGKTYVISKLLSNGNYNYIWVSGKDIKTEYKLILEINKKLSKYLPVKYYEEKISSIPDKGFDTNKLYEIFFTILEVNKLNLTIVIDEVDRIIKTSSDHFIQVFYDANSQYLKNGKVNLIMISNDPFLDQNFCIGVKDRIHLKIHFPKYSVSDIFEILQILASKCLEKGTYTDSDLVKIAKYVGDTTGSARHAKFMFYKVIEYFKDKDKIELPEDYVKLLNELNEDAIMLMNEKDITELSLHKKLSLYAIIESNEEYNKLFLRYGEKDKSILKFLPTTGRVYEYYKKECSAFGVQPMSLPSFILFLKDLEELSLIEKNKISLGRAMGVTSIINLFDSIDAVKPILEKSLGLKND